jgi:hypothetical protein
MATPITRDHIVAICEMIPKLTEAYNALFVEMNKEFLPLMRDLVNIQRDGSALVINEQATSDQAESWLRTVQEKIDAVPGAIEDASSFKIPFASLMFALVS